MEKYWVKQFQRYPRSIQMNEEADRNKLMAYGKEKGILFPEDYLDFMAASNGVSLFFGRVEIWKIPINSYEVIPLSKSMEYMNTPEGKASIPFAENVFLIGQNELGDYVGITSEEKGFDIAYISPDMGKKWYYHTFTEWLKTAWEEWRI